MADARRRIEIQYDAKTGKAEASMRQLAARSTSELKRISQSAKSLQNTLGTMLAAQGVSLMLRGLRSLGRGMQDVWRETERWRGKNDELIKSARGVHEEATRIEAALGTVVLGALESTGALGDMRDGLRSVSDAMLDSGTTIGQIVRGPIHLFFDAVYGLEAAWVQMRGSFEWTVAAIETGVNAVAAVVRGMVAKVVRALADLISGALVPLYQLLADMPEALKPGWAQDLQDGIAGTVIVLQSAAEAQEALAQAAVDARDASAQGMADIAAGTDAALAGIRAQAAGTSALIDRNYSLADSIDAVTRAQDRQRAQAGETVGGRVGAALSGLGAGGSSGGAAAGAFGGFAGGSAFGGAAGQASAQGISVAGKQLQGIKSSGEAASDAIVSLSGLWGDATQQMAQNTNDFLVSALTGFQSFGDSLRDFMSSTFSGIGQAITSAAVAGIGSMAAGPLGLLFGLGVIFSTAGGLLGGGGGGGGGGGFGRSRDIPDIAASIRPDVSRGTTNTVVQYHLNGPLYTSDSSRRGIARLVREAGARGEL